MPSREEYERRPAPKKVPRHIEASMLTADIVEIVGHTGDLKIPTKVGVLIRVAGVPVIACAEFAAKDHLDSLIEALIAARNTLWPTP